MARNLTTIGNMELGKLGIDLSNNRSTFIHQNRSVSPRGSNCNSIGMYSQLGAFQNGANAGQAFEEVIKLKKEVIILNNSNLICSYA